MLRRFFPHPGLSLLMVIIWLLLVNKVTPGNLILAVVLSILIPIITQPYWRGRAPVRAPFHAAEYILIVLWDIVVANVQVAYTILFKSNASTKSHWIVVPLDLKRPEAITLLAGTITMTPGTVSATLTADASAILVHCLDTTDPDGTRDGIKHRYERRLKRIFE
ncbi:MAG: Na+/H+ antiporter subunit E [Pseudomonadota bacterium]